MSVLDINLIKQFVEETNDQQTSKSPSRLYGTASVRADGIFVQLDGSSVYTPVSMATDAQDGDRVVVEIVDHAARIVQTVDKSGSEYARDRVEFDILNAETGVFSEIRAAKEYVDDLVAKNVTTTEIAAAKGRIDSLEAKDVTIEGNLSAATGRIGTLETNLTATNELVAKKAAITDLEAATARIGTLETGMVTTTELLAKKAAITELEAANAKIANLESSKATVDELNAAKGRISDLEVNKATINDLNAAKARIGDLEADHVTTKQLEAATGRIGSLETDKLDTNFLNANVGWIQNGVIKNGSIVDAMIHDVSANRLTAGTIDASKITVTNLNADNLTVGTINGARIGNASIDLSKLSEEVPTKEYLDDLEEKLQDQIDGAIETFTTNTVPTLNNYPASSWTTADLRSKHVGDICYVVNSASTSDGFCYRFQYNGSAYSWALIKDADVTKVLKEVQDLGGEVSQFKTDYTSKVSEIDGGIESLKTRTTTVETTYATKIYAEGQASSALDTAKTYTDDNAVKGYKYYGSRSWNQTEFDRWAVVGGNGGGGWSNNLHIVVSKGDILEMDISNTTNLKEYKMYLKATADATATASVAATVLSVVESQDLVKAKSYADTKKSEAISAAATDATTKANAAKDDAISSAATLASNAKSEAISTAATDATSKANAAKTEAISSANTAAQGYASTAKSEAIAYASADASNKANNALDAAKTYANNIQVGGRNLLPNTDFGGQTKKYTLGTGGYTEGGFHFTPTVQLESDRYYTISMMVRGDANLNLYTLNEGGNVSFLWTNREEMDGEIYRRVSVRFIVSSPRVINRVYICTRYGSANSKPGDWFEIKDHSLKLEMGDKATDWTPAPEDIAADAQAKADAAQAAAKTYSDQVVSTKVETSVFNDVKQTVEENSSAITTLSNRVDTKADGSTVTTLSNTVNTIKQTTDSNTSSISSLTTTVNNKADSSTVTAINSTLNEVKQTADSNTSNISQLASTVKDNETDIENKYSSLSQDLSGFKTTVGNTYSTKNEVSGLTTRIGAAETTISQNTSAIALRATKTEAQGYASTAKSEAISTAATDATNKANAISSRGEQLVTNGQATLGNNTNFSNWTYDGSKANASGGSFTKLPGYNGMPITDEFFAVDASKDYRFEFDAMSLKAESRHYSMLTFYDVDKKSIEAYHHIYLSEVTELARELKAGDTYVYFNDISTFKVPVQDYQRSLIFWNYTNSFGYTYPPKTYSRNYYRYIWEDSDVDKVNNRIKLRTPWTGPTYASGTKVSQGSAGSTYKYNPMSWTIVPTEWTHYVGVYSGTDYSGTNISTMFPPGTAYCKIGFLWNYQNVSSEDQLWITNISVQQNVQGQIDVLEASITTQAGLIESKVSKNGVISSINQSPENITINANKININGAVTFSSFNSDLQNKINAKAEANAIPTKVSQLTDDVGIEGRNLFIDSQKIAGYLSSGAAYNYISTQSPYFKEWTSQDIMCSPGDKFMIQIWRTIPAGYSQPGWRAYQCYTINNDLIGGRPSWEQEYTIGSNGVSYSVNTITIPAGAAKFRFSARLYNDGYMKIEKGDKATPWTPAPEDIAAITDIPTKVSDLSNDSGFQTSSEVNSAITSKGYQTSSQVESAITSKGYATTSQVSTAKSEAISAAATDATSKANTALANAKEYTDAVEIGGVNLFKECAGTTRVTASRDLQNVTITNLDLGDTYFYIKTYEPLERGKQYTLSFVCEGFDNDDYAWDFATYNSVASGRIAVKNGRNVVTFIVPTSATDAQLSSFLFDDTGGTKPVGQTHEITFSKFMLERGNRASDWQLSPDRFFLKTLDAIDIGGRNLILDSKSKHLSGSDMPNATTRELGKITIKQNTGYTMWNAYLWQTADNLSPEIIFDAEQQFVFSIDVKIHGVISSPTNSTGYFGISIRDAQNHTIKNIRAYFPDVQDEWVRISASDVFTPHETYIANRILLDASGYQLSSTTVGAYLEFRNLKLEVGNKSTDWTPAPEDIDAAIDAVISDVDVEYYLSTSTTSLTGGSWVTTAPVWVDGKYMWSRTKITDGAGNVTYSPSVNGTCIAGATGQKGADGTSARFYVTLQASDDLNSCIAKDTVYTTNSTSVCNSLLNKPTGFIAGECRLEVEWLGSNSYLIQRLYCKAGANNKYFSRTYSNGTFGPWSELGVNGGKGDTGVGVSSIQEQYYVSTSNTEQTGGSWGTSYTWTNGKYIWTRSHVTYTDGSTKDSTPVLANGFNTALTTANTANTNASAAVSTANTANTNASNAISTANTAKSTVDNLKVGGRNLLALNESRMLWYNAPVTTYANYDVTKSGFISTGPFFPMWWMPVDYGETYTYSFYLKTSGAAAGKSVDVRVREFSDIPLSWDTGGYLASALQLYPATSDHTYTGTITPTNSNCKYLLVTFYAEYAGFEISDLKIERGNKSTDWTPAPEDVDVSISEATDHAIETAYGEAVSYFDTTTIDGGRIETGTITAQQIDLDSLQANMASFGNPDQAHIEIKDGELAFMADRNNKVAYVSGNELSIDKTVVISSMKLGKWSWAINPINEHLTVKWEG